MGNDDRKNVEENGSSGDRAVTARDAMYGRSVAIGGTDVRRDGRTVRCGAHGDRFGVDQYPRMRGLSTRSGITPAK